MPIPCNFFSTIALYVVQLEVRDSDFSRGSFIVQDCFSYPGFFVVVFVVYTYEVEYCSFQVCEELCWNFDEDCV